MTRDQDYQITYDLKAAYHHRKIHPFQTKFLGAAIPKPNGETQYFIFLFLPFGLSSAVHCIAKILKPFNAYLHEKGVRHSIYLDDGRVTAVSECQAEQLRIFVYDVLRKSGFIIEAKKSDQKGDASQYKEYLGFINDTSSMTVRLGETKKQLILRQVKNTILLWVKVYFGQGSRYNTWEDSSYRIGSRTTCRHGRKSSVYRLGHGRPAKRMGHTFGHELRVHQRYKIFCRELQHV